MKLNQGKRVTVLATVATTAAVLVSTGLASASPAAVGSHAPAAKHPPVHKEAPRPKPGLYVSGAAAAVTTTPHASAYVVDGDNYEHFATLVKSPTQPTKDVLYYYTRSIGAKTWTVHAAPTLINSAGSPRIEENTNWYSGTIEVVVYACDGVYAASVSPAASRVPEFTQVQTADTCRSGAAASTTYKHLSTIFHDDNAGWALGVLTPDSTTSGTWDLMDGNPGGSFSNLLSLPTTHSFVPTQIAASPDSDTDLAVVGYGVDSSGNKGVFATTLSWAWNQTLAQYVPSWSALKEVATLGEAHANYYIQSLAEYDGTTDIGLYKAPDTSPGQKHTLFVDEGDTSNQWSSPIALAHTNINDRDLLLLRNPQTGTLHTTWERTISSPTSARTAKSGIMQERLHVQWTKALFLSHWYKDKLLAASVDTDGNMHVEYQQS